MSYSGDGSSRFPSFDVSSSSSSPLQENHAASEEEFGSHGRKRKVPTCSRCRSQGRPDVRVLHHECPFKRRSTSAWIPSPPPPSSQTSLNGVPGGRLPSYDTLRKLNPKFTPFEPSARPLDPQPQPQQQLLNHQHHHPQQHANAQQTRIEGQRTYASSSTQGAGDHWSCNYCYTPTYKQFYGSGGESGGTTSRVAGSHSMSNHYCYSQYYAPSNSWSAGQEFGVTRASFLGNNNNGNNCCCSQLQPQQQLLSNNSSSSSPSCPHYHRCFNPALCWYQRPNGRNMWPYTPHHQAQQLLRPQHQQQPQPVSQQQPVLQQPAQQQPQWQPYMGMRGEQVYSTPSSSLGPTSGLPLEKQQQVRQLVPDPITGSKHASYGLESSSCFYCNTDCRSSCRQLLYQKVPPVSGPDQGFNDQQDNTSSPVISGDPGTKSSIQSFLEEFTNELRSELLSPPPSPSAPLPPSDQNISENNGSVIESSSDAVPEERGAQEEGKDEMQGQEFPDHEYQPQEEQVVADDDEDEAVTDDDSDDEDDDDEEANGSSNESNASTRDSSDNDGSRELQHNNSNEHEDEDRRDETQTVDTGPTEEVAEPQNERAVRSDQDSDSDSEEQARSFLTFCPSVSPPLPPPFDHMWPT